MCTRSPCLPARTAPWNYPLQLCFQPLVSIFAAGNTAVIKPSELAPACAALIERLVDTYLDRDACKVVQGAVDETTELLKCRFDHILYTGNPFVARIVAKAAAAHLTPVTLELGGKSPAIVHGDANIDVAARRILSARLLNYGQTCVAVDYVLVQRSAATALTESLRKHLLQFYGENPQASPDLGRIVNARHWEYVNAVHAPGL